MPCALPTPALVGRCDPLWEAGGARRFRGSP
jgi:hypothetical protein